MKALYIALCFKFLTNVMIFLGLTFKLIAVRSKKKSDEWC